MHNLIFLTDLTGSDLDPYMRLNEAQLFHALEPNPGLFIAESPKVIERALRAGYRPASLLIEEKELERDLADLDHEMAINQTRGSAESLVTITPSIPRAAAERKIAPMLVGLITLSRIAIRGWSLGIVAKKLSRLGRSTRCIAANAPRKRL